jgi:HlyD family secretion protein
MIPFVLGRGCRPWQKQSVRILALALAVLVAFAGCARRGPAGWQGYVEGEFVYVASPIAGRLERLSVEKGARVAVGAPLFALDDVSESDARREAEDRLRSSRARLEDLRKGSRPSEVAALDAQFRRARAAAELSRLDLERQESLFRDGAISQSDYDHARLAHEEDERAADGLASDLETAQLGGRSDAIAAAGDDVRAAQAVVAAADWSVGQKAQSAPCAGLVFDTLYRVGEFVAAGNPVVALLPPGNIKVRFFVPEEGFGTLRAGGRVWVGLSGHDSPLEARVSYLSPQPEYTPPVLYNRDNRAKLVYMVEAEFPGGSGRDLHPGQPAFVVPAAP